MLAPDVPMVAVGGLSDGSPGTDLERIYQGLKEADQGEGVVILMDMGSSVLTTEMALEMDPKESYQMLNCPMVEGAVIAASAIQAGSTLEETVETVKEQKCVDKW